MIVTKVVDDDSWVDFFALFVAEYDQTDAEAEGFMHWLI